MKTFGFSIPTGLRRHSDRLVRLNFGLMNLIWRRRPVPFPYWLAWWTIVRSISTVRDPLLTPIRPATTTGNGLTVLELRHVLLDDELGGWSLDIETIELLYGRLRRERPAVVLECGAGISTIMFAMHASLAPPDSHYKCKVVSIEQDMEVKCKLEDRLARHGLEMYARILHVPVTSDGRYLFDAYSSALQLLNEAKADWVLIDGPYGPPGCRVSTLPWLAQFCRRGARWFLDDAFRDGEMAVLRAWTRERRIKVEGIYAIGKGLATGTLR